MANEKAPVEFDAVLKEMAEKYSLEERKLGEAVRKELTNLVAKKIAEQLFEGKLTLPATPQKRVNWP